VVIGAAELRKHFADPRSLKPFMKIHTIPMAPRRRAATNAALVHKSHSRRGSDAMVIAE
jgi:hypothetical protein